MFLPFELRGLPSKERERFEYAAIFLRCQSHAHAGLPVCQAAAFRLQVYSYHYSRVNRQWKNERNDFTQGKILADGLIN